MKDAILYTLTTPARRWGSVEKSVLLWEISVGKVKP